MSGHDARDREKAEALRVRTNREVMSGLKRRGTVKLTATTFPRKVPSDEDDRESPLSLVSDTQFGHDPVGIGAKASAGPNAARYVVPHARVR